MKRSNKKRLQKAASAAMVVAMAASSMSTAFAADASAGNASAAKYNVIETEWGFNKVEQDGGKTLSYSPESVSYTHLDVYKRQPASHMSAAVPLLPWK